MGLMDKIKNLFTEEVEEEFEEEVEEKEIRKEKKEPIKKEMIQVEIPAPVKKQEKVHLEHLEEPEVDEIKKEEKEEFKFPFFDDEDFKEIEKEKPKDAKKPRLLRKEPKEVYNPPKEEKKVFKPSPIISPVYGILDKNYQKEDIRNKNMRPRSYYTPKEATVDEIRNKAYGTLEEELETTLFGKNRLLFDDYKEEKSEENIKEIEETIPLKEEVNVKEEETDLVGDRPRHSKEEKEADLTDLLNEEMSKEEKPHKISDSELFDMIDSMYQKGDK